MALSQHLTLSGLSDAVLGRNAADAAYRKAVEDLAGTLTVTKCRDYDIPVTSAEIKTVIAIEYEPKRAVSRRRPEPAVIGTVYVTGDVPYEIRQRFDDRVPLFTFATTESTRDAYIAMYDICGTTAENIMAVLRENMSVIRRDADLAVEVECDGRVYAADVRDLLRRRNKVRVRKTDGAYIGTRPVPKDLAAGLLEMARDKYADVLTPRKLERLGILVEEYRGLRPTVKQYQRQLREQRASA